MPGPNRAPRGGYQKPKDLKKTVSRLLGYLTRSKLPLLAVLAFLLLSVATNIGGSYMMRGIINDFVWSGCTDFAGLGKAVLVLIAVELLSAAATYGQSAIMVQLAQRGVNRLRRDLFDKLQNLPLSYLDRPNAQIAIGVRTIEHRAVCVPCAGRRRYRVSGRTRLARIRRRGADRLARNRRFGRHHSRCRRA